MNIEKHFLVLKKVAIQHRKLTGKHISGITGEIGEYYTAKLLNLSLVATPNNPGFDAIDKFFYAKKYQIKSASFTEKYSINHVQFNHTCRTQKWDFIVFCIMNINYEIISIYKMNKKQLRVAQTKSMAKYKCITLGRIVKYAELVNGKNLHKFFAS